MNRLIVLAFVFFIFFFIIAVPMSVVIVKNWEDFMKNPFTVACVVLNILALVVVVCIGIFYLIPKIKKTN